jgi:RNase H-fold protein (predicted Holliday junction resolvase)
MSRIVAFDVGSIKTGIAQSDESRKFVFPKEIIKTSELLDESFFVNKKYQEYGEASIFVLGYSCIGEKENSVMKVTRNIKKKLETQGKIVYFEDELGTSHSVRATDNFFSGVRFDTQRKTKTKENLVDAKAAALILERFLAKRNTL